MSLPIISTAHKKILINIFWLCSEYALKLISGIVVAALVARQLGVEQYGLFQYALSLVSIFMALSYICGAEVLVPRLVDANERERKMLMGNAFIIRIVFSLLAYLLLLLFCFLTDTRQQFYLTAILGLIILVSEGFAVVTAWLQSQTHNKPRSILINIAAVIKITIVASLFYLGVQSPLSYAVAWLIEPIIVALGLTWYFYYHHKSLFFCYSKDKIMYLWEQGLPFFGGLLAFFLFQRLDVIMLRYLASEYDLGIYSSAIQLLNSGVLVFAGILGMSMAPMFIYRYDNLVIIKKNTLYVVTIMFIFALISALVGNILAPSVILLLFGEQYRAAIPIFSWLLWGACLFFIDSGINLYLIKNSMGKKIFYKWTFATLVAFPVYYFGIKNYQMFGAIFGFYIGYVSVCIFDFYVFFNKNIRS